MPRLYRILSRSYNTDEVVIAHQVEDIRQQLNEQLRCLDQKLDTQTSIVLEMQDFFRKRAEVEAEYSRGLDRLTKQFMLRHKADKQKRENWPTFSTYGCWQYMMTITRRQSRDHAVLAELYATVMCQRLGDVVDDLRRTFVNCREISLVCHEEMLKVLNELQTAMKQYHVYHSECKQAELKFKHVEEQKLKVEQQTAKGSKKLKVLEKQMEKRQGIYEENKQKAQSARNDYLLAIDAANASLHKYFVDDLSLLIDSIDFGYHNSVQRAMLMCLSAVENLKSSQQVAADCINKCVQDLDPSKDKHKFIDSNGPTFLLPKRFEYQPHKGDEVQQVTIRKQDPPDDLVQRYQQLDNRLESIRLENEEVWKSVEEADKNLVHMINQKDYDVTECFQSDTFTPRSMPADARKRRLDTEAYYFEKLRAILMNNNLLARLLAKYGTLKRALSEAGYVTGVTSDENTRNSGMVGSSRHHQLPRMIKARRVAKTPLIGQPKVFGCNLEEYIETTGEQIPLVMRSCIRAINLHGMHHEGVFRVSGLQVEINEIKAAFEKGDDPLANVTDGSSVNSIAGVLKSFFRELKEPMFPMHLFDMLVEASRHESVDEAAEHIRDVLHTALSRPRIIVMRYLFAFLNHLSQYSDENLMYPYNLSICFGPTLLPIPPDKDQVAYQAHVNDLIKTIIVHQEKVFPVADAEPVYEKILIDGGDRDDGDGSEDEQSEEDPDVVEAVAAYDFEGRSGRELSFKKGNTLVLYKRVSADWWEGACQGKEGLIADKYIVVKRSDDGSSTRLMSSSVSSEAAPEDRRLGSGGTPEKRRSVDLSVAVRRQQHANAATARDTGNAEDSCGRPTQQALAVPARPAVALPPLLFSRAPVTSSPVTSPADQRSFAGTPGEVALQTPLTPVPPHPLPAQSPVTASFHYSEDCFVPCGVFDVSPLKPTTSSKAAAVPPLDDDDLDTVLASVMSDLQALTTEEPPTPAIAVQPTKRQSVVVPAETAVTDSHLASDESVKAGTVSSRRQTPDLVQDLPVGGGGANSDVEDSPLTAVPPLAESSPASTSVADAFANSKTNTVLRAKSSSMPRSQQPQVLWGAPGEDSAKPAASGGFMTDEPGRQLVSFRRATSMSGGSCPGSTQRKDRSASGVMSDVTALTEGNGSASRAQRCLSSVISPDAFSAPDVKAASAAPPRSAVPVPPVRSVTSSDLYAPAQRSMISSTVVPAQPLGTVASAQQQNVAFHTAVIVQPQVNVSSLTAENPLMASLQNSADATAPQSGHSREPCPGDAVARPTEVTVSQQSEESSGAALLERAKRKVPPPVPAKLHRPPPPAVLPKPHVARSAASTCTDL